MHNEPLSLFDILIKGGWMMVPIVLSSLVVLALGISRYLTLHRESKKIGLFVKEWNSAPSTTEVSRYRASCKMGPGTSSDMVDVFDDPGIRGKDASERVETIGREALLRLETGISTIATLAAITPLMGFLGTVTGMIKAFMKIETLSGKVNANVLAGGIWEALITTAAGLVVGIIALIIHNYLVSRIKLVARMIEQIGEITMRILGNQHEN